jgi:pimeloyl-ACP methyl ester carboxylesterase
MTAAPVSNAGVRAPRPGFLRWRSWGAGDRRALLLHGTASSSATWSRVAARLADHGWRVKAPDLPSHGASPRANGALTPDRAAEWVAAELSDRPFDLVLGHSFGAAVAVSLLARRSDKLLVLEEPVGPASVDWAAEAASVRSGAAAARRDARALYEEVRSTQPAWSEEDCRNAVSDLARCAAQDIAEGLRLGHTWPTLRPDAVDRPVLVLAAPDAPGVNRLADATVLRGDDRALVHEIADSFVEIRAGHSLHRDRPDEWLAAVLAFTG